MENINTFYQINLLDVMGLEVARKSKTVETFIRK